MLNKTIKLPWYLAECSPNYRGHWSKISKAKKQCKELAYIYTNNSGIKVDKDISKLLITLEYYPPSNRRMDLDNCVASSKAYLDGVAQALGVDDSVFMLNVRMMEQTLGEVRVTVG